ncbi:hypothetical protein EJ02DRAFT_427231 [Clathrospora elynae]|uniref:Peptidase S33 tripeptidyl aminopeptidase-like C-terminal domain-containing protein n=1 Tax=Clathrospora elynae TaxID=706981 RepID=A0A6A5SAE8_9PLEO|nr:hypothetical protein EJ02DRAFT_427231 [Clathrospora elynae]
MIFNKPNFMITAIDAAGRVPFGNLDEYLEVVNALEDLSVYAGREHGTSNALINAGAKLVPPASQPYPAKFFLGAFATSCFGKTKTSTLIMFVATAADPITLISGARHMLQYFEGSVVLEQDSVSHTFTSGVSKCTIDHVQTYLKDTKPWPLIFLSSIKHLDHIKIPTTLQRWFLGFSTPFSSILLATKKRIAMCYCQAPSKLASMDHDKKSSPCSTTVVTLYTGIQSHCKWLGP